MKKIFSIVLVFSAAVTLSAAPLENGFALAPRSSASQEERAQVFMEARNRVISAAIKYENTPYLYGGITSRGLDCSGLLCLSFRDALGVELPRSASGIYSWAEKISLDQAQPGDILFFRTDSSGSVTHAALYLGGRRFIHSASEGPDTGVIYSSLDEPYWSRTYAGAGRAFPAAPSNYSIDSSVIAANSRYDTKNAGDFHFGIAFAPSWNGFLFDRNFFRGFSSHLGIGYTAVLFRSQMTFGIELRPEYDNVLGVFRIPVTLSWGPNEKIRIFAGPVLSFGDASITTDDGVRKYSGGTSWFGSLGITFAPYTFKTALGNFAFYFEAAWQNYFSNDLVINISADASAFLRLSTGIRFTRTF